MFYQVIKGIQYSDSILLHVYCTQVSNWMHSAFGFDASNLTPSCNKHLTILNLHKVFPYKYFYYVGCFIVWILGLYHNSYDIIMWQSCDRIMNGVFYIYLHIEIRNKNIYNLPTRTIETLWRFGFWLRAYEYSNVKKSPNT